MNATVEGFSNYATAGVALTLDNDSDMAAHVRQGIAAIADRVSALDFPAEWNDEEALRFYTHDFIKDYVERESEKGDLAPIQAQMVQAGMGEVDWSELADHFLAKS